MDRYHHTPCPQKTTHISHSWHMNIISGQNLMDRYRYTPWPQKTTHISHSGHMNIISGLNLMDRYCHMPWSRKITNISHSRYMGILSGFEWWKWLTWWPSTSHSHHSKHLTSVTVEEWKLSLRLKGQRWEWWTFVVTKNKTKRSFCNLFYVYFVILHTNQFTAMVLNIQRTSSHLTDISC